MTPRGWRDEAAAVSAVAAELGIGVAWRAEMAAAIEEADIGFVEVMFEHVPSDAPLPASLERLRERGVTIIPHGVTLSLGGAEPVDPAKLDEMARLAERVNAPFVSEHMAFVRAGDIEAGHLLPLPRTRDALEVLVENVLAAKAALPVPLAIENIASLFEWPPGELDDAEFLTETLQATDSLLLLDVENLHANSENHAMDVQDFLDRVPLERLAYVHVGGGENHGGLYHDTHSQPTPPPALDLLRDLRRRVEPPGVLLERDDNFLDAPELRAELDSIRGALAIHPGP